VYALFKFTVTPLEHVVSRDRIVVDNEPDRILLFDDGFRIGSTQRVINVDLEGIWKDAVDV
jgi:hypothetical protein